MLGSCVGRGEIKGKMGWGVKGKVYLVWCLQFGINRKENLKGLGKREGRGGEKGLEGEDRMGMKMFKE